MMLQLFVFCLGLFLAGISLLALIILVRNI